MFNYITRLRCNNFLLTVLHEYIYIHFTLSKSNHTKTRNRNVCLIANERKNALEDREQHDVKTVFNVLLSMFKKIHGRQ